LFRTGEGKFINADVNGALNILLLGLVKLKISVDLKAAGKVFNDPGQVSSTPTVYTVKK
jgi:transposase